MKMSLKSKDVIVDPLEEHSEDLPRLWKDPDTGQTMVEFRIMEGHARYCLEKCVVVGGFETDILNDKNELVAKDRFVLRTLTQAISTAHHYETMRNLLWPKPMKHNEIF